MAARQGSLSDWRRFRRGTASVPQIEFSTGSACWNYRDCPPSETKLELLWRERTLQTLTKISHGSARKSVSCPESVLAGCERHHGPGRSFHDGRRRCNRNELHRRELCSCQMERVAQPSGAARGRLHCHPQPQG